MRRKISLAEHAGCAELFPVACSDKPEESVRMGELQEFMLRVRKGEIQPKCTPSDESRIIIIFTSIHVYASIYIVYVCNDELDI